ncbi:hypothetical protein HQN64_02630 [Enterobacteriaceae bacterium BIT-l23]|nr:hypothetical protein [Enterobacteriaceae bacterium BIT-l23]
MDDSAVQYDFVTQVSLLYSCVQKMMSGIVGYGGPVFIKPFQWGGLFDMDDRITGRCCMFWGGRGAVGKSRYSESGEH